MPCRSLAILLALAATLTLQADTSLTFQNGVNGYAASRDVSINTQYLQYNGGNGTLWRGTSQLACYTTTGDGSYTVRYLLKFGIMSIPAGSTVVSATLSLNLESWNSGSGNITGFYLKNTWNPDSNRIGWLHRDDTSDWAAAGASSPGVDTVADRTFRVPPLRPVGNQLVTIPLDLGLVQSWIDTPSANQGVMLVNNTLGDTIRLVSTAGTQSQRPKLTIVVASASGVTVTVSPLSATLQPGQTQQFTANTAVTWTATSGTVSSTGLYTAGSTVGSFTVKATSVADPTKSATAAVTIQIPQVTVTILPPAVTLQPGQAQQFAANTAVTWTATGGTISSTGLYTAGTTAGSFTAKATSVADSTKSATAAVTIQPPQVTVSISPLSATMQPGQTQQFSANTAVTWSATGGTVSSTGLYTAGQTTGNFAVTARSVADTTATAMASVRIDSTTGLPPIPRQTDGAYVVVQSPVSGMHFTAPATVRIYADPLDNNAPDPDALTVNFLLNGQSAGTFTGSGAQNGYFALTVNGLAAGTYAITAQITTSRGIVSSAPVTIFVDNPAVTTGQVFNLTADVVLSGSQVAAYSGTPANHCVINGNGFQIRSAPAFSGSFSIAYCDIRGLGSAAKPAIDVTVNGSGSVQLTGNVFDTFGAVNIGANDQAQAVVRGNEFRANTLVPVGSQPSDVSTLTAPVFYATGNSSSQKYFQGNNVGLSTVVFDRTRNWLIGGGSDTDSNVLMGVRCGFTISGSSNMVLRGNYSQHNYPHRFSQGENFQLVGGGFLVEHNVIRGSSWPVRGMGGEFRYNLVDESGNSHAAIQSPMSNTNIHHNVFLFSISQTFYGPDSAVSLLYNVDNLQFRNNVLDGGGAFMAFYGNPISVTAGSFIGSLRNNVFYNFASPFGGPALSGGLGESTNPPLQRLRYSDYNAFYSPAAPNQTNYGLGVVGIAPGAAGYGMHDLGGFNGHMNPKFVQPTAIPFPFRPDDIWNRTKKVSDVLGAYRGMYSPAAGSPLIAAGDPQDGAGGNIGAVGNGEAADLFGIFGGGSTPAPFISSFTGSPSTVQPGQSATLSWSVSGATNLSIAPAPGAVTGTSVTVNPSATTTYTLTAANSGGSTSATATVTVAVPPVSVSVSPTSATVLTGGTQQFTANTAVTWTATGGTITTTGLFTAGQTTGAFQVKATSVQDSTKSATAAVTISAPTVSVSVSPTSATVLTGGTQQFTANTAVTWTATGGTITTTGLFTAGQTIGAFQVKATSVQDSTKSATAAVTVAAPTVSVSVSPTSATVLTGGTQQFTANTAVTWTATGGTITTAGLFTAGQTTGAFQVKATSVQDSTKSATAAVTIAAPTVSVSVSPTSATVLTGGTQQFTANTAVTWTATGGTITTAGLFTAGQTTGAFQVKATSVQDPTKSATAPVTIVTQTSGDHPRIILDAPTLAALRGRASANTPQWRALKSVCDSLVGGTVNFPGGGGYPNLPNVGEGYQGSSYLDAMMPLGICYHTLKTTDPVAAANYGAKAIAILTAMSDPAHQVIGTTPIADRDNGYGIRFYGVTMGMGYDWFHDLLTPALMTQVQNALDMWIHGFETDAADAFEYDHPMGNYFAGYYAAKCMAALAVQGDSPLGDTWWNDWYNRQHNQRLQPYYALNMAGGGWPEGFANYGPLATRNQALPALAVRTAKGIDLIHAAQPYAFPLDQARWVMSFTWPSRDFVDDRDTVHSNSSNTIWPGTPDANTYSFLAGYLAIWNDPLAPAMHRYARDAKAALTREGAGSADAWVEFLFWDDAAPESDYSSFNLSYLASGTGEVAARSDWTNAAAWMSFRSGSYVNNPAAGHQSFNAGSLALVRGKSPLLVNVEGWLAHNPNGNAGENAIYEDMFGNWDANHATGNRRLYNTFQVRHVDAGGNVLDHFGQWALQRSDGVRTQISRYEDGGSYVLALGRYLEDMYRPFQTICGAKPISSWSRQVVYLRPSQFVVYDRTTVCDSSLDQYMAFHFPGAPVEVAAPAAGLRRFDVNAGAFAGSMTTILPAGAAVATTDHVDTNTATWSKVWRSEIRPPGSATAARLWLTAFDLSATASQVAAASPLTVIGGAAVGAVLASPAGNNVVVFGSAPAGTPVSGTIAYSAPAAQSRHVITDLALQAGYTVSVTLSGANHVVTVTPGGTLTASANGVLSFAINAAGALQP